MKTAAAAEYEHRKATIAKQIEALQDLAAKNFGHDMRAVHYGHCGDLGAIEARLAELLSTFGAK